MPRLLRRSWLRPERRSKSSSSRFFLYSHPAVVTPSWRRLAGRIGLTGESWSIPRCSMTIFVFHEIGPGSRCARAGTRVCSALPAVCIESKAGGYAVGTLRAEEPTDFFILYVFSSLGVVPPKQLARTTRVPRAGSVRAVHSPSIVWARRGDGASACRSSFPAGLVAFVGCN